MKYEVNLYPERGTRRGDLRRGAFRGLLAGIAVGLVIITLGFLILSGTRMTREASRLEAEIAGLRATVDLAVKADQEQNAGDVVTRRGRRIDWTALVSEIAAAASDEITVIEVRGLGRDRDDPARRMLLVGNLPEGTEDLAPALALVDSLRAAPETAAAFPVVALETAKTSARVDFQIICRAEGASR